MITQTGQVFRMELDDYAQMEWLHRTHQASVKAEMEVIAETVGRSFSGDGWSEITLRGRRDDPFGASAPHIDDLRMRFPVRQDYTGLRFWTEFEDTPYAFAFACSSGVVVYGESDAKGRLCVVGFAGRVTQPVAFHQDMGALAEFAAEHDLLLVSWVKLTVCEADADFYMQSMGDK